MKKVSPTILGFVAIGLWSTTVAFTRSLSESLGPFTSGAFVYFLSGIFLLSSNKISKKPAGTFTLKYLFGCGAFFVIYTISLYTALYLAKSRLQSLEIGLINYLWPGFTLLFSIPILKRKASIWIIPGILLAFWGEYLAITQGSQLSLGVFFKNILSSPLPYFLGLVAAVFWALYSNLSRIWATPDGRDALTQFSLTTGLVFLILNLVSQDKVQFSWQVVVELLLFSVSTAIAYLAWDIAMRKGNSLLVTSVSFLIPILSTIVSSMYLSVTPAIHFWIGAGLTVVGSWICWKSIKLTTGSEQNR